MYFDTHLVKLVITAVWIVIGIALIIAKKYTDNVLFLALGVTCIIASIASFIVMDVIPQGEKYYVLKFGILAVLGVGIFFGINKKAKLNEFTGLKKKDSEEN